MEIDGIPIPREIEAQGLAAVAAYVAEQKAAQQHTGAAGEQASSTSTSPASPTRKRGNQ